MPSAHRLTIHTVFIYAMTLAVLFLSGARILANDLRLSTKALPQQVAEDGPGLRLAATATHAGPAGGGAPPALSPAVDPFSTRPPRPRAVDQRAPGDATRVPFVLLRSRIWLLLGGHGRLGAG